MHRLRFALRSARFRLNGDALPASRRDACGHVYITHENAHFLNVQQMQHQCCGMYNKSPVQ